MEILEERRLNAKGKCLSYQEQISKAYNKKVRPRTLCLLRTSKHIQKGYCALNLLLSEGLYVIREAYDSGYFLFLKPDIEDLLPPIKVLNCIILTAK